MATIDERVVEMRFDNKDFEKNVQTSLKTLDKLKDSLDFNDATKSLDELQNAAKHFTLDDIGNAIEDLSEKFSWENVFKIDLLRRTLDLIEGEIKRVFSVVNQALMLDQVDWVNNMALGWDKYAEKTQSVATIMAATGESIETVNAQMERLMFFTDETSYNFTDMAGNIGKFTANGVSLEQSVSAMEGIANWAARSGQEAAAASRVMYNLSQAIGMGSLRLQDWKSVELANMGTKEFKEVAIAAGLASGTLEQVGNDIIVTSTKAKKSLTKVDTNNFRESLKEGWLDTDTLIATLNEYGKASELISQIHEATGMWTMEMKPLIEKFRDGSMSLSEFEKELDITGDRAQTLYEMFELLSSEEYAFSLETYYAGQEARTFSQAMKSVSDAVSSGWMKTFELIFGQYEQAKELWSDLAENLFTIFRTPIDDRNDVLTEAAISGWDNLTNMIQEAGVSLEQFEEALIKNSGLDEKTINELAKEYNSFADAILDGALGADRGIEIVQNAIDNLEGSSSAVGEAGTSIGLSFEELEKYGEQVRSGMYGWYTSEEQVQRIMAENADITEEQAKMIVKYAEAQHEVHRGLTAEEYKQWLMLNNIEETQGDLVEGSEEWKEAAKEAAEQMYRKSARKSFLQGLIDTGHIAVDVVSLVRESLRTIFPPTTAEQLSNIAGKFEAVAGRIRAFFEETVEDEEGNEMLKNADKINTIKNAIALLVTPLRIVWDLISGIARLIVPIGRVILGLLSPIFSLFGMLGNAAAAYREASGELEPFANIISKISAAISVLLSFITKVLEYVGGVVKNKIIERFSEPFNKLLETFAAFKAGKLKGLDDFIAKIEGLDVKEYGDKVLDKLRKIWNKLRAFKNSDFFAPIWGFFTKIPSKLESFKNQINKLSEEKGIGKLQAGFIIFNQKVTAKLAELQAKLKAFSFKDFVKNMKENFKLTSIGQSLLNFRKQINALADEKGITKFQAACEILKNKVVSTFEELKNKVKTKLTNLGLEGLANSISVLKGKIVAKFNEIKAAIEAFLQEHGIDFSAMFTNFKASVKTKLNELGLDFIWNYLVELKAKISGVIEDIKGIIGSLLAGEEVDFKEMFGLKKEGSDEEGGILAFFTSIKEKIIAKLTEIKTSITEFFAGFGIDFSQLFSAEGKAEEGSFGAFLKNLSFMQVLKGGAIAAGITGLAKLLLGIEEAKGAAEEIGSGGVGGVLEGVVDALNPFGEHIERFKQAISGFNIVTFALGLLILAGAFKVLATLPMDSVALALGTAGIALGEFIGTIFALNKILSDKKIINFVGLGIGMMAIAGAMFIMAKAIETFKNIDFQSGSQALKTIGLLVISVMALKTLAKIAGKFKFGLSGGLGLMAAAGAMYLFAKVMERYAKLDINKNNILKVLAGLITAITVFSVLAKYAGESKFKLSNGLGLIAMALSLLIFAGVVKKLGSLPVDVLLQGGIAIAVLGAIMTAMVHYMSKAMGNTRTGAGVALILTLVGIAASLVLLSLPVIALGLLGIGTLAKGVITLAVLGAFLVGMVYVLQLITKMTGLKQSVAIIIILMGVTLALAALAAIVVVLGVLAIPALLGIGTMFLLMIGLTSVLLAISELGKRVNIKSTFAIVGALVLFVVALIGLTYVIKELADVDAPAAMEGMILLSKLLEGFMILLAAAAGVGVLAATFGKIFLIGMVVVAVLFAGFILAIHQAITELERLASLNTEGIYASIDAIDALLDEFCNIAKKFNDNGMTFGEAISTSAKMFAFGIGLAPLINDAQLLSLINAEAVVPGIQAVDALIDYMISLRDKFLNTDTSFGDALSVAATVFAFGVGLHPLANDVQILGLSNATAAVEAIAPMEQLINMMIGLSVLIGADPAIFNAAIETSGVIALFGLALLPLVADTFIAGLAEAETVKANLGTVSQLIDQFFTTAEKVGSDPSLYEAAKETARVIKSFARALALLVGAEFLAQFVNCEEATNGFKPVKDIIGFFMETAENFTNGTTSFEDAKNLAQACKQFAIALAFIIGGEFIAQFVNAEAAETAFQPAKDIITFFLDTAKQFTNGEANFEDAQKLAATCKDFAEALVYIVGAEFIAKFLDSKASADALAPIKEIITFFIEAAEKFTNGTVDFEQAKGLTDSCKSFAEVLVAIAKAEFISALLNSEANASALAPIKDVIDFFVETAQKFNGEDGNVDFETAKGAAEACKDFGDALVKIAAAEYIAQFIKEEKATDGFQTVKDAIDFFVEVAQKFDTQNGGVDFGTAKGAAEACKEFGDALVKLSIAELISGLADAQKASESLEVIKQMVGMFMLMAYSFNNNEGMFNSAKQAADACGDFAKAISGLTKGEKKVAKVNADAAKDGLEAIRTTIEILISLAKEFIGTEGMKQAATDAADAVATFSTKLKEMAGSLNDGIIGSNWSGIDITKVTSVVELIVGAMKELAAVENAANAGTSMSAIADFMNSLGGLKTTDAIGRASFDTTKITSAIDTIKESISNLATSVGEFDGSNFSDFINSITTQLTDTTFVTAVTTLSTFGTDMVTNIASGIEAGTGIISDAIVNMLKKATSAINAWKSSFYSAGYNMIIGFNNGMVAAAPTVYKNARIIANGAANIMRNTLLIRSPSRVFAEIGEYTMLGFAKGIEDSGGEAIDSVVTIGDALITAMQNAMAFAADSEYGFTPTITPVMDMSNMNSQSSMLRGVVGSFDMRGAVANANIDGATINNSIQSKDIINEIRQLNERLAIMDENLQNMQLVLDTGTLVGATSAKMDNQFGKMAMRRGRGN